MRTGTALFLAVALLNGTPRIAQAGPAENQSTTSPVLVSRSAADVQFLWTRIKGGLGPELYDNFDLFIYVNKAAEGPWAQHLYAFAKPRSNDPDADLLLMLDTPVSTGREARERAKNGLRVSTSTPEGFYELDPQRFEEGHRSAQWLQDMPNAMFLDWENNGVHTGLAFHGVTDHDSIAALGHRASAGCIQMSLDASRKLMDLVRDNFEGQVPRFAYDKKTHATSTNGEFARDQKGQVVMADGYRALVIIEDFQGGTMTSQLAISAATNSG